MGGDARTRLLVDWGDPRAELRESLRVLRTALPPLPPQAALTVLRVEFFRRRWPTRALSASIGLHLVLLLTPLPGFLLWIPASPAELRAVRIEYDLQWTGNARLLPPITPKRAAKRTAPAGGKKEQPPPQRGAETRQTQTIISDPPAPNHPRQTLLTQFGLDSTRVAPRDLRLPNMVIPPAPEAAPQLEVDLRRTRRAALSVPGGVLAPSPPRPKSPSELALRQTKLENLFPRLAVPPAGGSANVGAAPDVDAPGLTASSDLPAPGVLALSAEPAPPRPVLELPEANLRARFSAGPVEGPGSPSGVPGGAPDIGGGSGGSGSGGPGGSEGSAGRLTVPGVFVEGAGPAPPGPVIVGPPSAPSAASPAATPSPFSTRREPTRLTPPSGGERSVQQRAEEMIEGLTPGAQPSGGRRVYTVYINMPNLTSQTGSWVLRFAELGAGASSAGGAANGFAIEAPVAVKKVDPRYPGEARRQRLEGVVFLYGVIRADGTVESVQVVRSVHALLDENAVAAFRRWRFEPGRKNGAPVPLEVVVEIPFRLTRLF